MIINISLDDVPSHVLNNLYSMGANNQEQGTIKLSIEPVSPTKNFTIEEGVLGSKISFKDFLKKNIPNNLTKEEMVLLDLEYSLFDLDNQVSQKELFLLLSSGESLFDLVLNKRAKVKVFYSTKDDKKVELELIEKNDFSAQMLDLISPPKKPIEWNGLSILTKLDQKNDLSNRFGICRYAVLDGYEKSTGELVLLVNDGVGGLPFNNVKELVVNEVSKIGVFGTTHKIEIGSYLPKLFAEIKCGEILTVKREKWLRLSEIELINKISDIKIVSVGSGAQLVDSEKDDFKNSILEIGETLDLSDFFEKQISDLEGKINILKDKHKKIVNDAKKSAVDNVVDSKKYTSFGAAIKDGNILAAKNIYKKLEKENSAPYDKDNPSSIEDIPLTMLLWHSAGRGDLKAVEYLVSLGANVEYVNELDSDLINGRKVGVSVLENSVSSENIELVRYLIKDLGLDINSQNLSGENILAVAVLDGKFDFAENLLSLGADMNFISADGKTLYHMAAQTTNLHALKWLMEKRFNPSSMTLLGLKAHALIPQSEENRKSILLDKLYDTLKSYEVAFHQKESFNFPESLFEEFENLENDLDDDNPIGNLVLYRRKTPP